MSYQIDEAQRQQFMNALHGDRDGMAAYKLLESLTGVSDEPVWYHKIGEHGEHRFYDQTETQPEGCTPLFAHPAPQRELSNGEIYTAYIEATNQTLRPQDERLALDFARAVLKAAKGETT